ncbi:serine hydrolase domain-containing protein [Aminipila sp.]|uniref:serine hydrolase domain-containing protein n=1 Tax=Aminipila sp. TaxID=2060095 RepID=UPI002F3F40A8
MMDKVIEIEKVFKEKCKNTGAVIVQKNGVRVYEYYQNECTEHSPFHVFSVTKSILSILLGIAIDKGYIKSIDQPILDFFPDYTIKKREKTIQQIKLRDMMTMTAPFKFKSAPYTKYFTSEDWVKSSLDLLGGKGTIGEFRYAPLIGPDIFSGVLAKTTGISVLNFANKYLFRPLEIEVQRDVVFHSKEEQLAFYKSRTVRGWVAGPTGVHTGGWGLMLTPDDMIKLGQLYLNEGQWNGQQIVSKEWIRESTEEKSRWGELKYGLLWWIIDKEDHSFAALGDGGNVIYVNPKQKTVIIIASYFKPRVEDRMKLIKEYIEPIWSE